MEIIEGKQFCDDRGYLGFINDLNLSKYKRFYTVQNHTNGFVRAWHGHKQESKAVICIQGAAKIAIVPLTPEPYQGTDTNLLKKWLLDRPIPDYYCVSGSSPKAIIIPKGYANAAQSLTNDCILMYFSDKALGESHEDDYRYAYNTWTRSIWESNFR